VTVGIAKPDWFSLPLDVHYKGDTSDIATFERQSM
jgi:hypothetical protein